MGTSHVADAEKYAKDVVGGRIPANKWVKLACKRHLDDRKLERDKGFPFKFDKDEANKVCALAELLPHTKGKWASKKELIKLGSWQKFILCCLFGWLKKSNGKRRYRKAYLKIPRKNGKSVLAAIIAIKMFGFDGEFGAEVYSGATTEKQAWEVFRPAKLMIERSPELKEYLGVEVWAKSILLPEDGSRIEPVIGKPGDGSSPSCAIADEFHEHETPDLIDTMETGMGAREQPLLVEITTAGFNISGPCFDQEEESKKVLDGVFDNPELFSILYGIDDEDDWTSLETLKKANPNYGVSVEEDFLISQQRQAILNPVYASRFKTKHLNVWCSARESLINMVRWDFGCDQMLTPEELRGESCVFSIDLASKTDLCAVIKVFRKDISGKPHFYIFGKYYLPEDTIDFDPQNSANYKKWVAQGYLTPTDGATVDFDLVTEEVLLDAKDYNPSEVVYDPHNGTWMAQKIMEDGGTAVEFPQNAANMGPATDEFIAAVHDYRVHHDGNPITKWCVSNLVARRIPGKFPVPTKQKKHNKIDGAIASIMGVSRLVAGETEAGSVYETHGVGI